MQTVIVGVQGRITDGTEEIELLVHSHNLGHPSPCHVYENGVHRGMIGGSINSLDQIFTLQAARHAGFTVKGRGYYLAQIRPETEEEKKR